LGGIREFGPNGCTFDDGRYEELDAVIFATGFRSNVPSWLKVIM
jgi:indole-3-pyruvate monooxygenase